MSNTPNLDKLKHLNNHLSSLLEDPQVGLWSWNECLRGVLKDIAEFAPKPEPIDYSKMDCAHGEAWEECTPTRAEDDCNFNGKCKKCPSNRKWSELHK